MEIGIHNKPTNIIKEAKKSQKAGINTAANVVVNLIGAKLIHDRRRKWVAMKN